VNIMTGEQLLFMIALAYGLGVLFYSFVPISLDFNAYQPWRVAALPFVAMVFAQTWFGTKDIGGPVFGGVYLIQALIAAIIGVAVDWGLHLYRQRLATTARQPRVSGQAQPQG
jgi:hypothetical protein